MGDPNTLPYIVAIRDRAGRWSIWSMHADEVSAKHELDCTYFTDMKNICVEAKLFKLGMVA